MFLGIIKPQADVVPPRTQIVAQVVPVSGNKAFFGSGHLLSIHADSRRTANLLQKQLNVLSSPRFRNRNISSVFGYSLIDLGPLPAECPLVLQLYPGRLDAVTGHISGPRENNRSTSLSFPQQFKIPLTVQREVLLSTKTTETGHDSKDDEYHLLLHDTKIALCFQNIKYFHSVTIPRTIKFWNCTNNYSWVSRKKYNRKLNPITDSEIDELRVAFHVGE